MISIPFIKAKEWYFLDYQSFKSFVLSIDLISALSY
jgi:hypothetical protein